MTIHWKAVEQYFTVALFVFQFYPVCYFVKFINLDLALSGMKVLIILILHIIGILTISLHHTSWPVSCPLRLAEVISDHPKATEAS